MYGSFCLLRGKPTRVLSYLVAASFFIAAPPVAFGQTTYFPARGIYNGYLQQTNILECDNSGSLPVDVTVRLISNSGVQVGQLPFRVEAFGTRHIILNELAAITDSYGTYSLTIPVSQRLLGDSLNCRTAFYRNSVRAGKSFEYAYVLPVQNPQLGVLAGMYNSFDPGASGTLTYNWLSVINMDPAAFSADVAIYATDGTLQDQIPVRNLAPGARVDIPLGHQRGQNTGLYVVRPNKSTQLYDSMLIRYNSAQSGGFNFAFPLRAIPGSCNGEPLLASTMGNGLTDNWLEMANASNQALNVRVEVRDRTGSLIHTEQRAIGSYGQNHLFLSSLIDPSRTGNVGSVRVLCSDPKDRLVVQSSFYGHVAASPGVEWAYSTQSRGTSPAGPNAQLNAPVNTFVGMANWLKLADVSLAPSTVGFNVYNAAGQVTASGSNLLGGGATADVGVHAMLPANQVGLIATNSATPSARYNGEILRVLARSDGQIGTIVSIPAIVKQLGIPGTAGTGFRGDPQSLAPYREQLTTEESALLLSRATFGGSPSEIQRVSRDGLAATVTRLSTVVPETALDATAQNWFDGDEEPETDPYFQWYGIRRWWVHLIRYTQNPLKERMALILHDLFATSCRVIDNGSDEIEKCRIHVDLLRRESFGNFRRLLKSMTTDYAMLVWLSNNMNRKEQPNENYAREHWELFSIGEAVKEGGRYLRYTDEDIKEAARAFTGWTTEYINRTPQSVYVPGEHDEGIKTLWRGTPYEVSGNFDYASITDLTLDRRPESAQFVARRIFNALVHDHPNQQLIEQMANLLRSNNYELLPLVRTILRSEAMFSADARQTRVKDPISFAVGFLRRTGLQYRIDRLEDTLGDMGMRVTDPPDVNGWPGNKYLEADQTDFFLAWAPQYANAITDILRRSVDFTDGSNNFARFLPTPTATGDEVVDYLTALMDVQPTADERASYIQYMNTRLNSSGVLQPRTFNPASTTSVREKVAGMLWILSQHEQYITY